VQSDVTDLPFFATTVKLGKKGVEEIVAKAASTQHWQQAAEI
jgi:hypothetical protein